MLPSFALVVLFWECQPDYLAQNNVLTKRESSWWKINKVPVRCSPFVISKVLQSLHAWENWSLLVLAKINALLACSQMLAKTIRYPSISLTFSKTALRNSKISQSSWGPVGETSRAKVGVWEIPVFWFVNFQFCLPYLNTPNFSRLVYFLLFAARRLFPFLCVLQVQVL